MLQAAVIAGVLAYLFRNDSANANTQVWRYLLAGYAGLAATVPWLLGSFGEGEFSPGLSAALGVIFALPVGVSAALLHNTAYQLIASGFWGLVALWGLHLLASIGGRLARTRQ